MNAPLPAGTRLLYRSVFVSDTHLGTRGARCDFLADFLRRTSCQHLFLVGDIIDGWRLRKSREVFWSGVVGMGVGVGLLYAHAAEGGFEPSATPGLICAGGLL